MKNSRVIIASCCVGLIVQVPVHAATCPDVDTVQGLSIEEFTRASWYVQEQQVNSYQKENQLECVVATYEDGNSCWWKAPLFFEGKMLSVYNSYDGGRPTVDATGKPINRLCATVPNTNEASKLSVAPCFLPAFFGGKYWVVGLSADTNGKYEWAVISGGPPKQQFSDGCTTGTGYFDSGLWIFSRTPILPEAKLQEARQLLIDKGYTLQFLKKVRQKDCTYSNAYIKSNSLSRLYSSEGFAFKAEGNRLALGIVAFSVLVITLVVLLAIAGARKMRSITYEPVVEDTVLPDSNLLGDNVVE